MIRFLLLIPVLLLLWGCPPTPVTFKTITLNPSQLNWSYEYWWSEGPCIPTFGAGPWPVPAGQIASGYDDSYQGGSGLFGCDAEQQQLYRGHVAFDLSKFDQIAGATLNFNVISSVSADGGVNQDNPARSYATVLGMSVGTKNEGNGPYYWDYINNPVSMPACTSAMFEPCSVDVTPQVKQWVANTPPNLGFIIAGPILDFPDSLPKDNNGQLSFYGGFQLKVLYNPALNPRAPQ